MPLQRYLSTCKAAIVLSVLVSLTSACTMVDTAFTKTRKAFAPAPPIEILSTAPKRAYTELAPVEATGTAPRAVPNEKTTAIKNISNKAKALGADAVIITEENATVANNNITYNLKGVAIRYGDQQPAPAGAAVSRPTAVGTTVKREPVDTVKQGDWLSTQNPEYYTIQLIGSGNEGAINRYIEEQNLGGQAAYFKTTRNGQPWYTLVYGKFATKQEAKKAIQQLPPSQRKTSPWVRKFGDIQKTATY